MTLPTFKTFFNVTQPGGVIGVAVKRDAFLYIIYEVAKNGDPIIFQVIDKGIESMFASIFPSTADSQECEIEVNPGFG